MNKRRKIRKDKFWSGSGKFFLIIIIIYFAVYAGTKIFKISGKRTNVFKKSDLEIVGIQMVPVDKIYRICGFPTDSEKEIMINIDSLASNLMELKYIKGISITKRPPKILNITVEEYDPVAFIYGRGLNLIDADGYLIPVPESQLLWDLPFISGINQQLGKLGHKTIAADAYLALEIIRYLDDENPLLASMVSEINLNNSKMIELHLIKGGTKIRVSRESFYKELFILKNYIANYLDWRQLANIDYIDLRFKNQLIVKEKT